MSRGVIRARCHGRGRTFEQQGSVSIVNMKKGLSMIEGDRKFREDHGET